MQPSIGYFRHSELHKKEGSVSKLHLNKGPLSASNAFKKPKTAGALLNYRFVPMTGSNASSAV